MSPVIRHPKRRGEWVELQFMARAAAHGLTVSKPWGDCARYDFIVESRGKFHRVQVKSTTNAKDGAYLCNTASVNPYENFARSYTREQIDFFAFYIIPEDVWFIVPIAAMGGAKYAVYLNPRRSRGKYFRYLEAWHLLNRGARPA